MTFEIPPSVRAYLQDRKTRESVDALLDVIDGSKSPTGFDRAEAQNFNQALLAAFQSRTDYVDLMFRLWGVTFGTVTEKPLSNPRDQFESGYYNPEKIWTDEQLGSLVMRRAPSSQAESSYELGINLLKSGEEYLCLYVVKIDPETGEVMNFAPPDPIARDKGWLVQTYADEGYQYAETARIPTAEFLADPSGTVSKLATSAAQIVEHLA